MWDTVEQESKKTPYNTKDKPAEYSEVVWIP